MVPVEVQSLDTLPAGVDEVMAVPDAPTATHRLVVVHDMP